MFKKILIIHLVVSVAYFAIALLAGTPHHFVSLIAGCSMMGINLALVIWTWSKIFRKKSIALASSVIVFKYAILGVFIYLIV
ncbi:MAG: hypothetical protein KDD22_08615, partial [Bdellovibrionales bacterium]|nr:hypothetical protein [Bdellovibrionales bacterium]